MDMIKQAVIGRLSRDARKPQLMLIGQWLEEFHFILGTFVSIAYKGDHLILNSCGTDIATYHRLAQDATSDMQVICVTKRLKDWQPYPLLHLVLNGELLTQYGFYTGDIVVIYAMPGTIYIKRLDRLRYQFNPALVMKPKVCHVHCGRHRGKSLPKIQLTGDWLLKLGFTPDHLSVITYEPNKIIFQICNTPKEQFKLTGVGKPKYITVGKTGKGTLILKLQGFWLDALGFSIKTPFLIHHTHGLIQVTRLEV